MDWGDAGVVITVVGSAVAALFAVLAARYARQSLILTRIAVHEDRTDACLDSMRDFARAVNGWKTSGVPWDPAVQRRLTNQCHRDLMRLATPLAFEIMKGIQRGPVAVIAGKLTIERFAKHVKAYRDLLIDHRSKMTARADRIVGREFYAKHDRSHRILLRARDLLGSTPNQLPGLGDDPSDWQPEG